MKTLKHLALLAFLILPLLTLSCGKSDPAAPAEEKTEQSTDNPADNPADQAGDNTGDNPGDDAGDTPGDDTPGEEDPGDTPGGDTPGEEDPGEEDPGEDEPEGAVLYFYEGANWGALQIYGWIVGTTDFLCGAWPGVPVTETEVIIGFDFYQFAIGKELCGKEIGLVVHDGGGRQSTDYSFTPENGGKYYLYVSPVTDSDGHFVLNVIADPDSFEPDPVLALDPDADILPGTDPAGKWSVVGNLPAMGANWTKDLVMTETSEGVWELDILYQAGSNNAFKLRYNGSWAERQAGIPYGLSYLDLNREYTLNGEGSPDNIVLAADGKLRVKFTPADYHFIIYPR